MGIEPSTTPCSGSNEDITRIVVNITFLCQDVAFYYYCENYKQEGAKPSGPVLQVCSQGVNSGRMGEKEGL